MKFRENNKVLNLSRVKKNKSCCNIVSLGPASKTARFWWMAK